jgi:hypothetical protein
MTKPMTWQKYAELFRVLGNLYRAEWKCDVPPFDTLPSEELDRAVSEWCFLLAKDLRGMPETPPAIVRPWFVVRLICAEALARSLAEKGDKDVPPLCNKTLRRILISEWHGGLRDKWPLMLNLENE